MTTAAARNRGALQTANEDLERIEREIRRDMPGQDTALAMLDWLFESRIRVFRRNREEERAWLGRFASRLNELVPETGVRAAWHKQMVLWLSEACLADESLNPQALRSAAANDINEANLSDLRPNFILSDEGTRVIRIAKKLASEFRADPITPTLRDDLTGLCLAYEHPFDAFEFFVWSLELGVIRSKKCRAGAAGMHFSVEALGRVGLQFQMEAVRARRVFRPRTGISRVRPEQMQLSPASESFMYGSMILPVVLNHRSMLNRVGYANALLRAGQWMKTVRRPVVGETLGKWLAALGALMVARQKLECPATPIFISGSRKESVPAIKRDRTGKTVRNGDEDHNRGTLSDQAVRLFRRYGLTIRARTINDAYQEWF